MTGGVVGVDSRHLGLPLVRLGLLVLVVLGYRLGQLVLKTEIKTNTKLLSKIQTVQSNEKINLNQTSKITF